MINLPITIPISNSDRLTAKRAEQKRVDAVERVADVTQATKRPFVERRKNPDRRGRGGDSYMFESRAGGDRRKGAWKRPPIIDERA